MLFCSVSGIFLQRRLSPRSLILNYGSSSLQASADDLFSDLFRTLVKYPTGAWLPSSPRRAVPPKQTGRSKLQLYAARAAAGGRFSVVLIRNTEAGRPKINQGEAQIKDETSGAVTSVFVWTHSFGHRHKKAQSTDEFKALPSVQVHNMTPSDSGSWAPEVGGEDLPNEFFREVVPHIHSPPGLH